MKKQFEWEYISGDGSFYYDRGSDTYAVKYGTSSESEFSSREEAASFYESIQPKSLGDGKALWQYVGGSLPELIYCHEAVEAS